MSGPEPPPERSGPRPPVPVGRQAHRAAGRPGGREAADLLRALGVDPADRYRTVRRSELLTEPRPEDRPGPRPEDRPARGPRVVGPVTRPQRRGGRWRRFVRRFGWRAYALPLLAVATLVVLADLVLPLSDRTRDTSDAPSATGAVATATTAVATAPTPAPTTAPATVATTAPPPSAEGEGVPTASPPPAPVDFVEKGAGTVSVVDSTSPVYGSGPLRRFVVEVEDGIGVDGPGFAAAVESTLADPRSWGNGGRMSFQRVGAAEAAAGAYDFKVTLVSPGNMERYCPGVGTGGYTSCRYGERAVINLARWETAVPDYDGDVTTYRLYVVNHEVGHALGQGHQKCPGPGQLAPVMQQQTLGLEGCLKNAWPHP